MKCSPGRQIYADCFGKEVMSSLREEMYAAHVKCSGHHPEALPAADAIVTGDDELWVRLMTSQH